MRKLSCHQSHGSREVRRNGRKDARKEKERGAAKERYILLSDFVCILIFYVYFTENASLLLRILSRSSTLIMPMSWRKWSQGHHDEEGRMWSKVFSSWLVSVLLHPPERVYQMCNWVTNLLRFASFSFCSFHSIRYGELQGLRNYTRTPAISLVGVGHNDTVRCPISPSFPFILASPTRKQEIQFDK